MLQCIDTRLITTVELSVRTWQYLIFSPAFPQLWAPNVAAYLDFEDGTVGVHETAEIHVFTGLVFCLIYPSTLQAIVN